MGATLRDAGINWNLAPVVDVAVNLTNPAVVTLGRTFGADPQQVIARARAFVLGMHEAGLRTTLKHFPGHGSSRRDSHAGFTDVSDTASLKVELAPYRRLIAEGMAASVMTAHVFNRGIDPWGPATLSRFTINRYLRDKRRYAIVGVFVIAAVLTPPDVISQLALAFPTLLLYEVSIYLVAMVEKKKAKAEAAAAGAAPEAPPAPESAPPSAPAT